HGESAPGGPAFGRGLLAKLAQLLTHGGLFAAQPRRQKRTDGGQRPGASQHHPQAPQGQDGSLRFAQVGQVGPDDRRPFGDTGVARHRDPPWGDGSNATSHTMPHRGVSCHLLYAVVPSFFKNLLQKALLAGAFYGRAYNVPPTSGTGHPLAIGSGLLRK